MREHMADVFIREDPFGPKLHRAVVGFEWNSGRHIARPMRPFRPRGLALFETPVGSSVRCFIGTELQVAISFPPIPCKFFLSGLSFEEICKRADENVEIAAWGSFRTVMPGNDITIEILDARGDMITPASDPNIGVCMWGYTEAY